MVHQQSVLRSSCSTQQQQHHHRTPNLFGKRRTVVWDDAAKKPACTTASSAGRKQQPVFDDDDYDYDEERRRRGNETGWVQLVPSGGAAPSTPPTPPSSGSSSCNRYEDEDDDAADAEVRDDHFSRGDERRRARSTAKKNFPGGNLAVRFLEPDAVSETFPPPRDGSRLTREEYERCFYTVRVRCASLRPFAATAIFVVMKFSWFLLTSRVSAVIDAAMNSPTSCFA